MDMANDKFKITNIDDTTGNITVEFTFKGKVATDTIGNLPLQDDKALKDALNTYAKAFRQGLKSKPAKKTIDPKVTAMINVDSDINEDINAQQSNN